MIKILNVFYMIKYIIATSYGTPVIKITHTLFSQDVKVAFVRDFSLL